MESVGSDSGRNSLKADRDPQPLRLADRVALRPKEAAEALGVSERTVWRYLGTTR